MSAPSAPPPAIVWELERAVPGVYLAFWSALIRSFAGIPVEVTSYWRGPDHNRRVGGHPDSQHLVGLGIDVRVPLARKGEALGRLSAQGLYASDGGSYLHVQAWPAGVARRSGLLSRIGV